MKNIIQEIKDCCSVRINCGKCESGESVYFIPESIISKLEVVVAKMETTTSEANDCRKAREVLTRVHEFLSNLCRDARCDDHCSECFGASDLADDVYDVLHTPPRNCDLFGGDPKMLYTAWFDWTASPSGMNDDGTVKLTYGEWLLVRAKGGAHAAR